MKAIILAAGMGTRLRPLTDNIPKSLVKVNGEPIIERQIKFLIEKGIKKIIIVVGYCKDKFKYLREKYNVKLIYNDKYNIYNNIYSMYLVKELLEDCYIIEADVYMVTNYFKNDLKRSTYFCGIKENFKSEWKVSFDDNDRIKKIQVGPGTDYIQSGISYWNKKDCNIIRQKLEEIIKNEDFKNQYWDNIIINNMDKLNLYIEKINSDDWFEIDCIDDLKKAEFYIKNNS
ncbi:NTP transferase domain-containing protein [Clostridium botulinum C]|uniref:CTP--phosphocholine cytidylyltransferase n=2 Tax=Clostridium botulinum TaxID=1491 RepID=A0A9Q4THP3_CLOBO|nr:sugar phosphate nucleotidyltransferase [Clostridium botulinum]EGO87189.1 CTP:phosphocholine cytidylyltransferase [Clostridium botulinum C str. Stockholm]MCD3194094.1 NTP transferase domain-containing protein [Clostridium botulinum C]MCD3199277.1 NTP transferase domain-containing protein [Clostridium botulinum C]MCD3204752.1 NTP transferase domain-containing protein [Clostridium botulinum C]MCD3208095.1 NTP transferase domain-containing protein [Clostridium botulinum C]